MSYINWDDHQKAVQEIIKLREDQTSFPEISAYINQKYNLNTTDSSVRHAYKRRKSNFKPSLQEEIANQDLEDLSYKETVEICSDGSHKSDRLLRMSAEECKDPNYLLEAHGYDKQKWELINAKNNIWNVYSKKDGVQVLYSSRITARPIKDELSLIQIKDFFEEMSRNYIIPSHTPVKYSKNGKMLELNIADLHLGKLCWVGDSNDHYDEKTARERFFYAINDVLTRTRDYELNKILFVWSNDFFHYDTINVTTTAGTRQDSNLRWQQMFNIGVQMLIEAIDILSQRAPVETMYIGSNHDKMMSYYATMYLRAWFRNYPNIKIDTDGKIRKYLRFGKCLIGFSHGNSEKNRLGKLMPKEAREDWGKTLFHEMHAAHIHSEKAVVEDNGVIVRHISSPTGTDNWHFESGWIGAQKKTQSFLWDPECGLELIINTPIIEGESYC